MTNSRSSKVRANAAERAKCAASLAPYSLLLILLAHLAYGRALGQQTHVLLDDAKTLVTRIELSPGAIYALPKDQAGSVWIAIDPIVLVAKKNGIQRKRQVRAGEAEIVGSGEELEFQVKSDLYARLVVVKPKMADEELTVGPFLLSRSIEDASDRNVMLLVAISSCRFSDTRNLGDESEWIPSKPDMVVMKVGSVHWIRPGIHHFKNLGPAAAELVSIEW